MKRMIALMCAAAIALCLSACTAQDSGTSAENENTAANDAAAFSGAARQGVSE